MTVVSGENVRLASVMKFLWPDYVVECSEMFHSSALARGGAVLDQLGIYIELGVSYFEHLLLC